MDFQEKRCHAGPHQAARIPKVNRKLDLYWILLKSLCSSSSEEGTKGYKYTKSRYKGTQRYKGMPLKYKVMRLLINCFWSTRKCEFG